MYVCMYIYIYMYVCYTYMDFLLGASVMSGSMEIILGWPARKDDTHTHTHREV